MIIRYEAPGPWWDRGINLLRLLPGASVQARPETWDLDVIVASRGPALYISVTGPGVSEQAIVPADKKQFLHTLFKLLGRVQNKKLSPWGILTGVRPGKVAAKLLEEMEASMVMEELSSRWLVSTEKAKLLIDTVNNGYPLLNDRGLSIYISVPFCPSRCHYCSFASLPLGRWQKQLTAYVKQAAQELAEVMEACRTYGYPINSVYVGGGTPTALSADQMAELLAPVANPQTEFTVEAGRPDTLSLEHIRVMEDLGVNRISVNSQFPDENTLVAIGRKHTVEEFYTALDLALNSRIDVVNSDLIIGLPGQNPQNFADVLANLVTKGISNITIHSLALKRGANTKQQPLTPSVAEAIAQGAYQYLDQQGFLPYYLYRQKNIAANMENVGFGKPDKFCYYNIASIAETEPVLGVGAGAISKLVRHNSIETLNNPRDLNQYLERSSTLVRRKLDWLRRSS